MGRVVKLGLMAVAAYFIAPLIAYSIHDRIRPRQYNVVPYREESRS